jgi:hypothetical protein
MRNDAVLPPRKRRHQVIPASVVELTTLLVACFTTLEQAVRVEGLTTYGVVSFTRVGVDWRHAGPGWWNTGPPSSEAAVL